MKFETTAPQAFTMALRNHQAGRLDEAEAIYRQILAAEPQHAEARHYLGVVALQRGRQDLAVELIRQSLAVNPENPAALSNLGAALSGTGNFDEAAAAYQRAIALKPDYPEAHLNLGLALIEKDRNEEAVAAFRRTLELRPNYPEASFNLGTTLARLGRTEEAIAEYRRALAAKPNYPEALNNLGNALNELGRLEEALAAYHEALKINPAYPEAHSNVGTILARQNRPEEALAAYQRALQLRPNHAETCTKLGNVLRNLDRHEEAVAAHRRALELKPDYAPAYNNLGNALSELGNFEEALAAYRRGLELLPGCAETHYNYGTTLAKDGHLDEALSEYRRALEIQPNYPLAWINLGNALKDQGRLDEAVAACRRARALNPAEAWMQSNVVCAMHFLPDEDAASLAEEYRSWNRQFGEPLERQFRPHANDRSPERRLRVGYLSSDFRGHVIGRNLLPLFRGHDRGKFEVVCYSGVARPDLITEEFHRLADQWRSTVRVPDEALAEMIRHDGVDILVDLAQHLAGNRLPVFARRPAPVQVSFAGYPASTGLEAIDCRISDRHLEGMKAEGGRMKGADGERVLLIDSFWCYDSCGSAVAVNELPALATGRVTFGSLNNFCKINDTVLRLWARVLSEVTGSRLILLSPEGSHRARTLEFLRGEGITADRLAFAEGCPRDAYLELYHQLDIALDPFPYGGHTTSLDAFWMGVPVINLIGKPSVSRACLSQLSHLNLTELAAFSEDDYVRIAAELVSDLPRLSVLRRCLRQRMEDSPLMNAHAFARGIESAYRGMWRMWVSGR